MLPDAGYDVQYRGKWHMSKDPSGTVAVQSRARPRAVRVPGVAAARRRGALPRRTSAAATSTTTACTPTRRRSSCAHVDPTRQAPFALFVCLVNPHDIMGYPKYTEPAQLQRHPSLRGDATTTREDEPGCFELGIELPPTFDEPKLGNYKPQAQAESTVFWSLPQALGPLRGRRRTRLKYVNFYAYLHNESDRHIGTSSTRSRATPVCATNTLVLRPRRPRRDGALARRHAAEGLQRLRGDDPRAAGGLEPDALPEPRRDRRARLADRRDADARDPRRRAAGEARTNFMGRDLTPIIRDAADNPAHPTETVQDSILLHHRRDDRLARGPRSSASPRTSAACARRGGRSSMYFDPDGPSKPSQLRALRPGERPARVHNMANPGQPPYYDAAKTAEMVAKLEPKMAETGTTRQRDRPRMDSPRQTRGGPRTPGR